MRLDQALTGQSVESNTISIGQTGDIASNHLAKMYLDSQPDTGHVIGLDKPLVKDDKALTDLYKVEPVASDKQRDDAEKTLEKSMSKLIPEADRATMKALTNAITHGDSQAFAEALKKSGTDPQKLKALVAEVDKMLEAKGCSTRLDVTADGKVLVSDTSMDVAVAFDPRTGATEGKTVEHNLDGSTSVKPGERLHVDNDATFEKIGTSAVNAINGLGEGNFAPPRKSGIFGTPFMPKDDDRDPSWFLKYESLKMQ